MASLTSREELLVGEQSLGIFLFSAGALGVELSASLQAMELMLDPGAWGKEGSPKHGMEIVVEPQDMNHEVIMDMLR